VRMLSKFAVAAIVFIASTTLMAQWPKYVPAGVPTGADGKIDVNAPAPRSADGHPDLSGVWEISRDPNAPPPAQGRGRGRGQGGGSPFGNIGNSMPEGKAPYQPWAEELVKKRMADNSKDNPDAHCLPMGIAQLNAHLYPRKIIQTPKEVLLIYEASGTTVREVFMDGRPLPKKDDVEPWYNGYSVGHWEGDALVVDTTNFTAKTQFRGSSENLHVVERFTRVNPRTLLYRFTVDDPSTWDRAWSGEYPWVASNDQIFEYACHEGNYSLENMLRGARAKEAEDAASKKK